MTENTGMTEYVEGTRLCVKDGVDPFPGAIGTFVAYRHDGIVLAIRGADFWFDFHEVTHISDEVLKAIDFLASQGYTASLTKA